MSDSMVVMTLPPGDKDQLACEGCASTQFHLYSESRGGEIETFHTVCAACGKRGALSVQVEFVKKHEFTQFMDVPKDQVSGVFTVTPGPTLVSTITTTRPPDASSE